VTVVGVTLWTLGHSTHPIERFLGLLEAHGIRRLADVRRYPTSRWPQFKQDALKASLSTVGIEYSHIPELGGYRKGGYEEHAKTPEFEEGLRKLVALAGSESTAIMCAEAVFFRCHRRYVADALVRAGHEVRHIFPDGRTQPHRLREGLDRYS
jgi:uncharacterized protein (DUF488 family)